MNFIFVTYERNPNPSTSDSLVSNWLTEQGHEVIGLPWTANLDAFNQCDLAVIRSTWDYPKKPDLFCNWLDAVSEKTTLANPVSLVKWNQNKRYLLDLQEQGIKIPLSKVLSNSKELSAQLDEWQVETGVLKPLVGASGRGVEKVTRASNVSELDFSQYILQSFVPEISGGEYSLAFFNGQYSHAVVKVPAAGEFRINTAYGGDVQEASPPEAMIQAATKVVESLTPTPLYVRVDGLMIEDEFTVFELELIEPSFYFTNAPGAAKNFGQAILDYLKH